MWYHTGFDIPRCQFLNIARLFHYGGSVCFQSLSPARDTRPLRHQYTFLPDICLFVSFIRYQCL